MSLHTRVNCGKCGFVQMHCTCVRHNHITRDIKPYGECPVCDEYHRNHAYEEFKEQNKDAPISFKIKRAEDTFEDGKTCERCKDPVADNINETPMGELFCDTCLNMDDVFSEDDE